MWKARRHGGTSIAEEETNLLAWIAAAVGIAVVFVVFFVIGGDKEKPEVAPQPSDVAPAQPPPQQARPAAVDDAPLPPPEPDPVALRLEVARDLETELQGQRLWSAVEVGGDAETTLVLRSAYCSDPGMKAAIDKLAGRMRSNGLTKIECYERHGSLLFEQML